jgi:lysophospholipase L1-like esterase
MKQNLRISPRLLGAIFSIALALCPQLLAASPVNWPIANPPEGTNPAVFPVPRNDWMIKFDANLQRAAAGPVDLLFEGDSISDFWMNRGKQVWDENYARYKSATFGISGDKTEHVLWRLRNGELDGLSPKLIVLMIGTNNMGRDSAAQIAEGVEAVVSELKQRCPKSHILLLAIFPRIESPTHFIRAKVNAVNKILAARKEDPAVTYLDIGKGFLREDGTLRLDMMPDQLHPNDAGYRVWADAIRPIVLKYLENK